MKPLGVLLAGLFCALGQAAVSDALFPLGGTNFPGSAGNVVFNGEHFVTPTVQSNGAIRLVFLNTNGFVISNFSLAITGSSPRVAFGSGSHLLTWLNADSTMLCVRVSNGVLSAPLTVATNVADETISLRVASGNFLTVWQSIGSNGIVNARWLASDGSPLSSTFAVAPSASAQYGPSLNNEGTNYLVCWMEQNAQSNDWRVVARFIDETGPLGLPFDVSQTNSFAPHPTGCSFGTNFLVAWSWDEGIHFYSDFYADQYTNAWYQVICGRMVSASGSTVSNSFVIARNPFWNTNPVVAFGNGNFLTAWATAEQHGRQGLQRLQPLLANGARSGYPIHALRFSEHSNRPRVCFGAGRFCVLYPYYRHGIPDEPTHSLMVGHEQMEAPALVNLRRTNGSIAVKSSRTYRSWNGTYPWNEVVETSTNGVDWRLQYPRWQNNPLMLLDLPQLTQWPTWVMSTNGSYVPAVTNIAEPHQLFVRAVDHKWPCIERLRSLDWAKQHWAVENKKANTDMPVDSDLFGPTKYLPARPVCPQNGVYLLNNVDIKPQCSVGLNHTL